MHRRTLLRSGLALPAAGLLLAPSADARPRVGRVLARGLRVPWGLAFLPGGRGLVSERDTGRIWLVGRHGGKRLLGEVPDVVSTVGRGGENGLMGLVLHPRFEDNRWLYAYLSTRHDNRVVRMRLRGGELSRPHVVLDQIPASLHHNGGGLAFGPDGMLYVSTGDAEHPARSRHRRSLAGKVLRIRPGGGRPRDNPFDSLVWSLGHRNVEGIAFDGRGRLWATEFGNARADELNRILPGRDYGWPRAEGPDGRGGFRDPLTHWRPEVCSPSGIAVVGGHAFVGALRGQALWSVDLAGRHKGRRRRHLHGRFGRIRGVHTAPDGSLWITTSNRDGRAPAHHHDDRVIRIRL